MRTSKNHLMKYPLNDPPLPPTNHYPLPLLNHPPPWMRLKRVDHYSNISLLILGSPIIQKQVVRQVPLVVRWVVVVVVVVVVSLHLSNHHLRYHLIRALKNHL